eukprot:CAMPEP_0185599086 /NCGR_PEP_ID=MMETSP0434-20130131/82453_1 /TAXON_ID=626734 ORGANISM="Favella taraikaensis, Strain Fe Narragansett Bay" /NCGR_SAMPLE_ID=MMETSP0434 /ASSEMBLY_ACC=CAM_ASM_000379 /LENGTH=65 /DNA_ID=CAMNT_0028228333 /DNA_START=224 /DNA_END=421 /DNA_ORIENTATION=-
MEMFKNANLMFDIDDELDSVSKTQAFVADVCLPHEFSQAIPSAPESSEGLMAQMKRAEEEEKKAS